MKGLFKQLRCDFLKAYPIDEDQGFIGIDEDQRFIGYTPDGKDHIYLSNILSSLNFLCLQEDGSPEEMNLNTLVSAGSVLSSFKLFTHFYQDAIDQHYTFQSSLTIPSLVNTSIVSDLFELHKVEQLQSLPSFSELKLRQKRHSFHVKDVTGNAL